MSTIAAISTPQSSGGIGIIRISGEYAAQISDLIFSASSGRKLSDLPGYRCAHGFVMDKGEKVDECIATVFRAPNSFTGENTVELSCHGGLIVLQRVLRLVLQNGAEPAGPGEFTRRAFLNGKIDLTEAEAVMSLINARGQDGARCAMTALDGALSRKINELNSKLLHLSANLGAWVDYPDDEIEELENEQLKATIIGVANELETLLSRFDSGAAISSGVKTAIIGKPNVGKSALMNLLSGQERSIVTSIPGTTRDVVEQTVNLGPLVLHLADTAGIRATDDQVERIGVQRARSQTERAGLIIAVFDGSRPFDEADEEIAEMANNRRAVAVVNKADLPQELDMEKLEGFAETVNLCAVNGQGLDELEAACRRLLCTAEVDTSAAMLATERQRRDSINALEALNEAIAALDGGLTLDCVNICVDSAIESLLSLTGERVTDAVVDEIFAEFCVGK